MRTAGPGYPIGMEPIPETFEALEEFGAYLYDDDLLTELGRMAARVRAIVPECVGLSLAYREHDVTFTLVATDEITAALDALQYLDHGPCVAAVDEARLVAFSEDDVLDEGLWHLFARGTAAAAVASTLTLPIVVDGAVGDRSTSTRAHRTRSTAGTSRSHECSARGPREPSSTPISTSRLAGPQRTRPASSSRRPGSRSPWASSRPRRSSRRRPPGTGSGSLPDEPG